MVTALNQLRNAIALLAAPPNEQAGYLTKIGLAISNNEISENYNIDELALQFEDATYLIESLFSGGYITSDDVNLINKLNSYLINLSGSHNMEFWTIRALYNDKRWAHMRLLAQECLLKLNGNSGGSNSDNSADSALNSRSSK